MSQVPRRWLIVECAGADDAWLVGLSRQDALLACIPVAWCDLWRYRNIAALCVLVNVQGGAVKTGSGGRLVAHHLESVHDGDGQVCLHRLACRQRR